MLEIPEHKPFVTDGKLTDILIEDNIAVDPLTGLLIKNGFVIWADRDKVHIIAETPGILSLQAFGSCFSVTLDKRYDPEWVKQEIIARVKCSSGAQISERIEWGESS